MINGQITGTCRQDDPRTKPGKPGRSDDPIVPLMQANVLDAASFRANRIDDSISYRERF